jgi:NAD(P)-dependent dehydrogenase (short-subunit alcohol dehydrogenase family)
MTDSRLVGGKSGLVTGGGSGIGRASALALAREGAAVMVADVNAETGQETVRLINGAGGQARFCRCDVSRDADMAALVAATVREFGGLDFAYNNAGISTPVQKLTAEEDEETYDQIAAVNLKGVWLGLRHEVPAMLSRGGGSIVNTASVGGLVGIANAALYVATKHGVVGLSKSAALEYVNQGIRINAVCPGLIRTRLYDARPPDVQRRILAMQPIDRIGEPEEVAELVVWLCSNRSSLVTGAAIPVDGAWTAR